MTEEDVKKKIREYLLKSIISIKDDISENESLIESGLIDSFGIVELSFFVKKAFGVSVKDFEILDAKADNLEKLAGLVIGKAGQR